MRLTLEINKREKAGKEVARKLRKEGKIPGVVYGSGEPIKVWVDEKKFNEVINKMRDKLLLVDLRIGSEKFPSIIKVMQRDTINDRFVHIDFLHIEKGKEINVDVPLVLKGEPIGLKKGGILDHHIYKISVKGTLSNIPHFINVDISYLDLGETLFVKDLNVKKVEVITHLDTPIVSILTPRIAEEKEVVEEEVGEEAETAGVEEKEEAEKEG